MKEDRAGRADTRPAQSFSPETVFAPCQRRKHHLLSSSSICLWAVSQTRLWLSDLWPAQARSRRRPQLLPAHTHQRAGSETKGYLRPQRRTPVRRDVSWGLIAIEPKRSGVRRGDQLTAQIALGQTSRSALAASFISSFPPCLRGVGATRSRSWCKRFCRGGAAGCRRSEGAR